MLAVQDKRKDYRAHTTSVADTLRPLFKSTLREREYHLTTLQSQLIGMDPARIIDRQQATTEQLAIRLTHTFQDLLQRKSLHLQALQSALAERNPKSNLQKGYTRIILDG